MSKNPYTEFLKTDTALLYLLGIIFLMTFSHFVFTGFTTCDDYMFYCRSFNDNAIWANSYKTSTVHGRFYFTLMMPTFAIYGPFAFGSYLVSRIITLAFIIAGAYVFSKNIKNLVKSTSMSYLFLLIYVVFVCIKAQNTPLTAFPVYFAFSWFLLQCSFYFFLNYLRSNAKRDFLLSVILYGVTMLFYEMYLLFIIVFFILHLLLKYEEEKPIVYLRKSLSVNYPFLILFVGYCIVYVGFKIFFSEASYSGVQVSEKASFGSSFSSLWQLTAGALPLRLYFSWTSVYHSSSYILGGHVQGLLTPLLNIKFEWLIKSILVGTSFLLIVRNLGHSLELKPFQKKVIVALLVLLLFLPNALLSLTSKYQELTAGGMYYYLTTYYASFAIYAMLACLCYYLLSHRNVLLKQISKWTLLVVLMWSSILTDYANAHAESSLNRIYNLFDHVDGFLKSSAVGKFNADATVILSPELYAYHSPLSYYHECSFDWSHYFKAKTGKNLRVVATPDSISPKARPAMHRLGYAQFVDGHAFVLSSYKADSLVARTLYVRSTKRKVLVNYLTKGVIRTEPMELTENKQYSVFEIAPALFKADSIWVSDVVY